MATGDDDNDGATGDSATGYNDDVDGDGDTSGKVDDDGDDINYGNGRRRRRW
jgi:hypothetical protein